VKREKPAPTDRPTRNATNSADSTGTRSSSQVSLSEALAFIERTEPDRDTSLWPGTPAWCELDDDDPRKLLALAEFGLHHVVRVEVAQQARADASRAVSAAADWPAVAREIHARNAFRAERPWSKRVVA
jgi:hypothetical protein